MNLIQIKEKINNANLLFLLIGALLVHAITSIENVMFYLVKWSFTPLPIKTLLILSVIFHSLILLLLIIVLLSILRSTQNPLLSVSLRVLQITGLIFALLISFSLIIRLDFKSNLTEIANLSQISNTEMKDFTYLYLISSGLIVARNIILLVTFLVIVFKRKTY